jgi:hypothetical protein
MKLAYNPKPLEVLNSVPETAKKLGGVSPWSVRAWLRDGRLERTKVANRTMVSDRAILEFIERSNKK